MFNEIKTTKMEKGNDLFETLAEKFKPTNALIENMINDYNNSKMVIEKYSDTLNFQCAKFKGVKIWVNEKEDNKISLGVDLDPSEFIKGDMFELEPNNPDTSEYFKPMEDILEEMSDKELLELAIEHLKSKLNEF